MKDKDNTGKRKVSLFLKLPQYQKTLKKVFTALAETINMKISQLKTRFSADTVSSCGTMRVSSVRASTCLNSIIIGAYSLGRHCAFFGEHAVESAHFALF